MKSILLTIFTALTVSNTAQADHARYREFNGGFANFSTSSNPKDRASYPGFSYLRGLRTVDFPLYVDVQAGFAFPTIVTAKTSVGLQYKDLRVSAGARPWPLSVGAQIEYGNEKFSVLYSFEYWELHELKSRPERDPAYFMTIGIRWERNTLFL